MNNHKLFKFIIIILLFIFNMNFCHAEVYKAKIVGTGVRARSGAGTDYDIIKELKNGDEYNLVSDELFPATEGCEEGWYQLSFGETSGYVCKKYLEVSTLVINEEADNSCQEELKSKGFPSSYWTGLCNLKKARTNWIFTPVFTNLDWSEAVNKESACGKSYIASSKPENIDTTCRNQYTSTWYPASSTAVAHYMDPRNWFTEQYIFQFEKLSYNALLQDIYASAANYSIRNAAFYKYHLSIGNDLGSVISLVGQDTNVSPVFLSSRMLQELGSKDTLYNLYSGVYSGSDGIYVGYYNFYNMGVSDSCATTSGPTVCGLKYAYNNGWNSLYNSIKGGASQIYNSYIAKGQYSTYFQKYNLAPSNSSSLYLHQYMTNIAAPSSESKTTYNSYNAQGILDNAFEFYIPVFNNIDNSSYYTNNGATGDTSEDELSSIDIDTILTSSGYKRNGNYIMGINDNTDVSIVKNNIEGISGAGSVIIKNKNGNQVIDGLIGTGYIIEISNTEAKREVKVVIKGDTSGDGNINALDLLQVQKQILGTYKMDDISKLAGDTSGDSNINALDLLQVQKHILGTYKIGG